MLVYGISNVVELLFCPWLYLQVTIFPLEVMKQLLKKKKLATLPVIDKLMNLRNTQKPSNEHWTGLKIRVCD